MRIVAISDTHTRHEEIHVPDGDVLVHAGDFTRRGELVDVIRFNDWLRRQPHKHKVVIAGNHDWCFQSAPEDAREVLTNAIYLQDAGVELEGVRFYGSPWQPVFLDWAFNLKRGDELRAKWAMIPADTEVLITHGPPLGYGDRTVGGEDVGCADLLERIRAIKPRVHIAGHIHEGSGVVRERNTIFVNASVLDVGYRVAHPARVVDL